MVYNYGSLREGVAVSQEPRCLKGWPQPPRISGPQCPEHFGSAYCLSPELFICVLFLCSFAESCEILSLLNLAF